MTTMILLAIDTAAPRLQLALVRDGAIDTLVEDMAKGQAERIFPAIAELLARNGTTYAGLTRIAVTTGPGSFTGLRIGLSAARGLALALNRAVVGVPSLLAISLSAPETPVTVMVDARRGEAYVQQFSAPGIPTGEPELIRPAEVRISGPRHEAQFADIAALARFAAVADPARFPPDPAYIRGADAKPQEKFRIARQ